MAKKRKKDEEVSTEEKEIKEETVVQQEKPVIEETEVKEEPASDSMIREKIERKSQKELSIEQKQA